MLKVIKIKQTGQYAVPEEVRDDGRIVTARPILPDGTLGNVITVLQSAIRIVSLLELLWIGILKLFRKKKSLIVSFTLLLFLTISFVSCLEVNSENWKEKHHWSEIAIVNYEKNRKNRLGEDYPKARLLEDSLNRLPWLTKNPTVNNLTIDRYADGTWQASMDSFAGRHWICSDILTDHFDSIPQLVYRRWGSGER